MKIVVDGHSSRVVLNWWERLTRWLKRRLKPQVSIMAPNLSRNLTIAFQKAVAKIKEKNENNN